MRVRLFFLLLALALTACGGGSADDDAGDAPPARSSLPNLGELRKDGAQ